MNKTLAILVAAGAFLGANAFAQQADSSVTTTAVDPATGATTTTTTTTTERLVTPPAVSPLTKGEQRDLRVQANADYKARKKIADADLAENKAACEQAAYGTLERDCKKDAKAQANADKADAKLQRAQDKVDINNAGQ